MKAISTTEFRAHLAELINKVAYGKVRIPVERQGKPLAALVPFEDIELLEKLQDHLDILEADAAKEEMKKKGGKPLDTLLKELDLQ